MATQALDGKGYFIESMVHLVQGGCERDQLKALECMKELFADHAYLATEKRFENKSSVKNIPGVKISAADAVFAAAITTLSDVVRNEAFKTLGLINKHMPGEAVGEVHLEAHRAYVANQTRIPSRYEVK